MAENEQEEYHNNNNNVSSSNNNNWGSVANLCSATLGAGAVSLPYAFQKCGLLGGILLLSFAALVTGFSIQLLAEAVSCNIEGCTSYESMSHKLCGPRMGYLVEASVILFCFGVCVAYIVAVGDMLDDGLIKVLQDDLPSFFTREFAMFLFWLVFMLPLSLLKKIDSLKFSSCVGVVSILFLMFVTVYKSMEHIANEGANDVFSEIKLWPSNVMDFVQACPLIMFAFSCQVNVPQIYDEMENKAVSFLMSAVRRSVFFCFFVYLSMGGTGYLQFNDITDENILKNYCVQTSHDGLVITAFVAISFAIVVAFPLNVFPCRSAMNLLVTRFRDNASDTNSKMIPLLAENEDFVCDEDASIPSTDISTESTIVGDDVNEITSSAYYFTITLFISGSSFLLALIVPDISVVFGFVGGTAAALLGFIMPAVFALKLDLAPSNSAKMVFTWSLLVGGSIVGVVSTGVTLYQTIQKEDEIDPCE